MTLNLAQRSTEVIDFRTNQKRVYDFLLDLNSNLGPILPHFRDITRDVKSSDRPRGASASRPKKLALASTSMAMASASASCSPASWSRSLQCTDFIFCCNCQFQLNIGNCYCKINYHCFSGVTGLYFIICYCYHHYSLLLLCHLSLVLFESVIFTVSVNMRMHLLLIHSGLGLVAFGLGLIALGLGLGLDLVASASYTSGVINNPGYSGQN